MGLLPGESAVEDRGEVARFRLVGAELEPALDAARDQGGLAVVDAVDEDDAGVGALRGGLLAQDRGEVGDVVGDEDPLFGGGECEHLVIVEALQRRLLVQRAHVVTGLLEASSDLGPGDVGVEQQPHAARLLGGLQERIELSQFAERAS